jgi:hypothetical protein
VCATAAERGSTLVVVFTVRVLALRPRRRVISVGFVVRVSTMLLRLVCILSAVLVWGWRLGSASVLFGLVLVLVLVSLG